MQARAESPWAPHTSAIRLRDRCGIIGAGAAAGGQDCGEFERKSGRPVLRIAGICGKTPQAVRQAEMAREIDYDFGLLSLAALPSASDEELLAHCRRIRSDPALRFLFAAFRGREASVL